MRLSTTTSACLSRQDGSYIPLSESLKLLHTAGFRGADIHLADSIHREIEINGPNWREWAGEIKELLSRLDMTAGQSHAPFYNVLDPGIADREFREEMVRRAIEASAIMGVKWVTLHPGTLFSNSRLSRSLEGNIDYFTPHLELAERCGVGIAIENLPDLHYSSPDSTGKVERVQRRFGAALEELLTLVDSLSERFDNVGVCWDVGHANITGHDQGQCLRIIGDRLKSVHIHDNKGDRDVHMPPYSGGINWNEIMEALRDIGYTGDFDMECLRFSNALPAELMPHALSYTYNVGMQLLRLIQDGK